MALFGFGKKKTEVKEPVVTRDQIINENRERANRVINALQVMRKKIDVDMMEIDVERKSKCIDGIRAIENMIATSPANDKEDAAKVDAEIKECMTHMLDAIAENGIVTVENGVLCVKKAVEVRGVPTEKNIERIKLYVNKVHITLEILLLENVKKHMESVSEDLEIEIDKLSEKIKIENRKDDKDIDEDKLDTYLAERQILKERLKKCRDEIDANTLAISDLSNNIIEIDSELNNKSILTPEKMAEINELIDKHSEERILERKEKFDQQLKHQDKQKAIAKMNEKIVQDRKAAARVGIYNYEKEIVEEKPVEKKEIEEKKEENKAEVVSNAEQAILEI